MDPDPDHCVFGNGIQGPGDVGLQLPGVPFAVGPAARSEVPHLHRPCGQIHEPVPVHPTSHGIRFYVDHQKPLLLPHFGERRALHRAGVEHRRGQGSPPEVGLQDLTSVDVPREDRCELGGKVGAANDIRCVAKRVVARADGGPLDTVVDTQKADVHRFVTPSGLLQDLREELANASPLVRKPGQRDACPSNLNLDGRGYVEDVEVRMVPQSAVGDSGPFVVAGNHEHRRAFVGDLQEGFEGLIHQGGRDPGPVKDVATVDYQVYLLLPRCGQGTLMVGEEVVAPTPPIDARVERQIEPEVGVGQQKDANGSRGLAHACPTMRMVCARCQGPFGDPRTMIPSQSRYFGFYSVGR